MKRILFVDDEPSVLDGLRRMLRSQRREWDMAFAASGREALELAEADPFDVIVTDMKMPEMDGAELLVRMQDAHPETVRASSSRGMPNSKASCGRFRSPTSS